MGTNWALVVIDQARPGGLLSATPLLLISLTPVAMAFRDAWENQYALRHTNAMDRIADADLDGMLNWQEYVGGADLLNNATSARAICATVTPALVIAAVRR